MLNSSVCVLLSTYNGTEFLKEQVISIFRQEKVNVSLYIRDDGSQDHTVDIIKEAFPTEKFDFVAGENLGAGKSFMELLFSVIDSGKSFDYYAFADQDDIWLPEKLETAIELLKETDEPVLYCSNLVKYINGEEKGVFYKNYSAFSLKDHIVRNDMRGCTFVFNSAFANIIRSVGMPCDVLLRWRNHDAWIYLLACLYAKIIYDDNAHILYRIHGTNASMQKMSFLKRLYFAARETDKKKNLRSLTAKELLKRCSGISPDDMDVLYEFANYDTSMRNRIAVIKDKDIRNRTHESKAAIILKVMFGYF